MQVIPTFVIHEPLISQIHNASPSPYQTYTLLEDGYLKVYGTFEHQFISNILHKTKIKNWNTGSYIIEAQTGSGKSTLVTDTIIPLAQERKKRVAIIVPRTALAIQYKKELAELYDPKLLIQLTEEGLHSEKSFGIIDVYTMQEFSSSQARKDFLYKYSSYEFVIFDEVHAFTGDASFNTFTQEIFQFLVSNSKEAKRIYITATLDIILQEIIDLEKQIQPHCYFPSPNNLVEENTKTVLYRFKQDYSFLNIILFTKHESATENMKKIKEGEKTIIFVDSKDKGRNIQELLGKDRATFINADNKMLAEADCFQKMLSQKTFDKQFLITTKFLDVGVNLLDETIRHIFVFHQYKEEVIQMLGRKRIRKSEKVTLYLYVPPFESLKKKISTLKDEEYTLQRSTALINSTVLFDHLPQPCYAKLSQNTWKIKTNEFAIHLNRYHQEQLNRLMGQSTSNDSEYYEHYKQAILEWFPNYEVCCWLDPVEPSALYKNLESLLTPYIGEKIERSDALKIMNQILEIFNRPRRKDQEDSMPITIIRQLFKQHQIPYSIENQSKNGEKGIYIITKEGYI